MLVEKCSSIHDMKRRLESAGQALQNEMMVRVSMFKSQLKAETLGDWKVKPLRGRGEDIETEIFDILKDEKIEMVDELLTNLPRILDTFILDEMIKRKPDTLVTKFPEDDIPKV
jgi:hypothetical protein